MKTPISLAPIHPFNAAQIMARVADVETACRLDPAIMATLLSPGERVDRALACNDVVAPTEARKEQIRAAVVALRVETDRVPGLIVPG